jgi:hypothetical protein
VVVLTNHQRKSNIQVGLGSIFARLSCCDSNDCANGASTCSRFASHPALVHSVKTGTRRRTAIQLQASNSPMHSRHSSIYTGTPGRSHHTVRHNSWCSGQLVDTQLQGYKLLQHQGPSRHRFSLRSTSQRDPEYRTETSSRHVLPFLVHMDLPPNEHHTQPAQPVVGILVRHALPGYVMAAAPSYATSSDTEEGQGDSSCEQAPDQNEDGGQGVPKRGRHDADAEEEGNPKRRWVHNSLCSACRLNRDGAHAGNTGGALT